MPQQRTALDFAALVAVLKAGMGLQPDTRKAISIGPGRRTLASIHARIAYDKDRQRRRKAAGRHVW